MTYVCSVAYMYALTVILGEVLLLIVIPGIGGKFRTHFSVQKVSGLCYCSEDTQGRISLVLLGMLPLIVIAGLLPSPECIFPCNTCLCPMRSC